MRRAHPHVTKASRGTRGIALLVTVIFMSVMLAFGLTLASLAYKQSVLSSAAVQSQYAFYAADALLECALEADQQQQAFVYATHTGGVNPSIVPNNCDGTYFGEPNFVSHAPTYFTFSERVTFNGKCADLTVYKYANPQSDNRTTYIFAQGYNVSCDTLAAGDGRIVARGIDARY